MGTRVPPKQTVSADAGIEHLNVHDAAVFVVPRPVVFIAKAEIQRQTRCDLPVILNEGVVGSAAKHSIREASARAD